jgi:hypothetical protein
MKPRLAVDLSTGLWELDLRAEVAWKGSPDVPRVRVPGGVTGDVLLDAASARRYEPGGRVAALAGAEWSHKYSDEDALTIGAEYFYNEAGYDRARILPVLVLSNHYTPYYFGRHYAGAYLFLPRPGSWNLHSFTLSAIANLSDRSGVVRLDWSYTLLTHLTLEAFVQGRAGEKGGEFRLTFQGTIPGQKPFSIQAPVADAGLALRLAL